MHFSSWKRILALALLGVLATMAVACAGDDGEQTPHRIGVMESVTGPGETYGNMAVRAKQMAADEINAAGGIDGRTLEFIVEDSKCSAQDAITAYQKLTNVDEMKIILGTSCSGAMLGVAPLAEEDGVVSCSPGWPATPTSPTQATTYFVPKSAISRWEPTRATHSGRTASATLATITEETDYAEGVRRTSVEQFEKNGGQVVAAERYSSDITDFRSQLTKLIAASPDALHIAPQSEFAAGTIVKQARDLGYQGPIYGETVYGGDHRARDRGRRGNRAEGHYGRSGPGQREGAGSSGQLP